MTDNRQPMPGDSPFPVVHAVSDSSAVTSTGFRTRATSIMRALGPRGALHLRSSRTSGREFHALAAALVEIQNESGCWLILNDRVDVAAAVGARGAQLASHSLSVTDARLAAPGLAVGASIHSVDEARAAEAAGAAWCVAGTVFDTPSHANRKPARVEFVEEVTRAVTIPVIAIGGIRPNDVGALLRAGAHGIATIRGAGWYEGTEASASGVDLMKTRLATPVDATFLEPVTRYISAYDAELRDRRDDHASGERRTPGPGA